MANDDTSDESGIQFYTETDMIYLQAFREARAEMNAAVDTRA